MAQSCGGVFNLGQVLATLIPTRPAPLPPRKGWFSFSLSWEPAVGEPYRKPFLTVPEQRGLLESRGLIIADKAAFEHALSTIGYYRLSAYSHTFRLAGADGLREDRFLPGTRAEQVLSLYDFDRRLKLLALGAIERIEIAVRFSVSHTLGRHDPFGHLNPVSLDPRFVRNQYPKWLADYNGAQSRAKEVFVEHFKSKYDGRMPIWVAVEILQLSQLSYLYQGLRIRDRHQIAETYGLADPKVMASWLRSLTYIRNVCAHHARLWNRNIDVQPRLPSSGSIPNLDHLRDHLPVSVSRPYAVMAILRWLMHKVEPEDIWAGSLHQLVDTLPVGGPVQTSAIGFPADWRSQPLWHGQATP